MTFSTVPLRRIACILNGGTPPSSDPALWDGEVPFATPPDLNGLDGAALHRTARSISEAGRVHSGLAPRGSILLSTRAPIGHIARIESQPVTFNQGCRALVPRSGYEPRFLAYALVTSREQMEARGLGTTFLELSGSSLADIRVPLVPAAVQRAIADYLDRETAQIDAFIAKNEELITLLTERRAAEISEIVCRGLNPNVELVPTRLAWAPAAPAGWQQGNIRRFASMKTGHTPSRQTAEYWLSCDIPWFTLADVWQLRQGLREMSETTEKISELGLANSAAELLPAGTVALSRTASVGFAGVMTRPMATSQDFWNWVPSKALVPEYLWYQFQAMKPEFERLMIGSTHRTIYQADAASFQILVPPADEQHEIVRYLDNATARIDRSIARARRAIELARERRAALISAAVTGKIDVGMAA